MPMPDWTLWLLPLGLVLASIVAAWLEGDEEDPLAWLTDRLFGPRPRRR